MPSKRRSGISQKRKSSKHSKISTTTTSSTSLGNRYGARSTSSSSRTSSALSRNSNVIDIDRILYKKNLKDLSKNTSDKVDEVNYYCEESIRDLIEMAPDDTLEDGAEVINVIEKDKLQLI